MEKDKLILRKQKWIEKEFQKGKDEVEVVEYGHQMVSNYRFAFPTARKVKITKEEFEAFLNKVNSKLYNTMYGEAE